jgi:hypothetical protein
MLAPKLIDNNILLSIELHISILEAGRELLFTPCIERPGIFLTFS